MYKIDIKKISIDGQSFYEVNGELDLEKRSLNFEISFKELKKIFDIEIEELLFGTDNATEKTRYIYVTDENNKYYSCIECIFSIHVNNNICFKTAAINAILENKISNNINIKTNKLIFKMYYLGHSIHSAYIKKYSFNYDYTKKITVNTYTSGDFFIEIIVESKKEYSYLKLSKIIYTFIEMLMLIFGDMPIIEEISLVQNNQSLRLYLDIVDKYNPKKKIRYGKEILGTITERTVNRMTIKKFEEFRKKTKIIYDLFMITINSNGYMEIKNCNLVQIMEGMYKTITGTNIDLRLIIIHFFQHCKSSRKLLSRRDKRKVKDPNNTPIFIYKANNHRNYLSHLNLKQNKNVFYKLENNYAYWKLCMCIRIYILEYLGIEYEKENISKYVKEIESWAKKRKLRFSAKINS